MDNTSSPDMRLVELECRNGHKGTPILHAMGPSDGPAGVQPNNTSPSSIGAYCSECRIWIKWVPKNEVWLSLFEWQRTNRQNIGRQQPAPPIARPELPIMTTYMEDDWRTAFRDAAQFCYDQAGAMGFHDGLSRTLGERCMLVITELAELFESYRKGTIDTPSDHIPDFTYREEEWADVMVRVFDHALDEVPAERLASAFLAKLAFNRTRGYRHGGKAV